MYDYVRVKTEADFGFWEINLDTKKAYFRDNSHRLENANSTIREHANEYNTIMEFLVKHKSYRIPYYKMLNPGRKIIYGKAPFCSFSKKGIDAHDPNTVFQCDKPALVIKEDGKLYCGLHADMKFETDSLINK